MICVALLARKQWVFRSIVHREVELQVKDGYA